MTDALSAGRLQFAFENSRNAVVVDLDFFTRRVGRLCDVHNHITGGINAGFDLQLDADVAIFIT